MVFLFFKNQYSVSWDENIKREGSVGQVILFSILLACLILLAAFFSCAETSLMAVNRYRLRHKARMKKRYAIRLLNLLKRPDRVLGVILIGNTFANMLASSLATLIALHFWGDEGALITAIVITFIVLIFAEIAPKTLAAIYPDTISRWVAMPIYVILKLLYPLVWFANTITNSFLSLFHIRVGSHYTESLSREELRSVVYDTSGKISHQYQNMLLGILDLNKLTVNDVILPRHEIKGIDIEHSLEKITEQLSKTNQEWIIFFRENINQIIGVLNIRDVLHLLLKDKPLHKEQIQQYMREPYFVPETTSLSNQLNYFQKTENKIAFVVDEYGEVKGILTLNDILEEIVGDFSTLTTSQRIQLQSDGSYLVEGAVTVREFNRISTWDLPLGQATTINGLIIEYLEALPHVGTAILVAKYPIEIMQVKENRVKLAKVFPRLS
jgi:magnesium and cobalt exporter, CNNM family